MIAVGYSRGCGCVGSVVVSILASILLTMCINGL
jgi:hypothetical protein